MRADLLLYVLMSSQCISEFDGRLVYAQIMEDDNIIKVTMLYRGSQFYWWRKPVFLEKITDLSQVTDKRYHINVVSITPHLSGIRPHNVSP
jgi:hypothetical protein